MKKFVLSAATVFLTLWANAKLTEIDLGDPETLDKIIAEAIEYKKLQERGEEGEELHYAPDQNTPYTGWSKEMHDNGRINLLYQYKDGKRDGLVTRWYSNGQKRWEETHNEDKLVTVVGWKLNGEKCPHTNVVDGNGVRVRYLDDGTEHGRYTYKDGKLVLARPTPAATPRTATQFWQGGLRPGVPADRPSGDALARSNAAATPCHS